MRATLTVYGHTGQDLRERAEEELDRFYVPNRKPSSVMRNKEVPTYEYTIDARPATTDTDGKVTLWEGEVTALGNLEQ